MSLVYDMQQALPGFRAQAEGRMVDSCTITGEPVTRTLDPDTAEYTDVPTTIYAGKCEIKAENVEATNVDAQGRAVVVVRRTLKLPVAGSEGVREGQTVTVTACVNDPGLVGNTYTVGAFTGGSFMTARRLPIQEQQ